MAAIAAMEYAVSREGLNQYTQSELRSQVFDGWSDCSSLMWKSYEKAYGIYIGSWTGEQVTKGQRVAFYGGKRNLTKADCDNLEIGDLIFFGCGEATHVEMYVGNYKLFGHGSGTPSYKDALTYTHPSNFWQARRYYIEPENKKESKPETIKPLTAIKLPSLKKGSKGKHVSFLQAALNLYNYNLTTDGDFGEKTEFALKTFQRVHKLKVTGKADNQTWKEINKNFMTGIGSSKR